MMSAGMMSAGTRPPESSRGSDYRDFRSGCAPSLHNKHTMALEFTISRHALEFTISHALETALETARVQTSFFCWAPAKPAPIYLTAGSNSRRAAPTRAILPIDGCNIADRGQYCRLRAIALTLRERVDDERVPDRRRQAVLRAAGLVLRHLQGAQRAEAVSACKYVDKYANERAEKYFIACVIICIGGEWQYVIYLVKF